MALVLEYFGDELLGFVLSSEEREDLPYFDGEDIPILFEFDHFLLRLTLIRLIFFLVLAM